MNRSLGLGVFAVAVVGALAWACSKDAATTDATGDAGTASSSSGAGSSSGGDPSMKAVAAIKATSDGGTVQGTAEFVEKGAVVTVDVNVTGATNAGEHGLHIHTNPSCEPLDGGPGLGAGGHWNPGDAGHGYPRTGQHHLGDLGNIVIDDAGKGSTRLTLSVSDDFYVHEGPLSVVGHSVVFHAYRDDGTGTIGDAGARPGCGVIEKK